MHLFLEVEHNDKVHNVEFAPTKRSEVEDVRIWILEPTDAGVPLRVTFEEDSYLLKNILEISNPLITYRLEIEAWISDFLREEYEREKSGFDDSEDESTIEPQPYDPSKINIRTQNWSMAHMFEMIDKWSQIELSPDFQRNFVWNPRQKSQLIESLMLRIPVPAFYLSETLDGRYLVVDGVQRLTTIKQFLKNEFPLKHLEYLKDEEGKFFIESNGKKGIISMYWRNILQTQITVNIIEADSPTEVKFAVFRRLNTGGKPLNPQEIRNCMSETYTRNLVNELAFSEYFHKATGGSVGLNRMEAQELVLRFIGFWHDRIKRYKDWEYRGNMTDYLDNAIDLLNRKKSAKYEEIKDAFYRAMGNAIYLFGQYSFRKCLPEHLINSKKQLINKALFTTWSVLLSEVSEKVIEESNFKQEEFAGNLAKSLKENIEYFNSVSYKTNDRNSVDAAFANADMLINEHFKL